MVSIKLGKYDGEVQGTILEAADVLSGAIL